MSTPLERVQQVLLDDLGMISHRNTSLKSLGRMERRALLLNIQDEFDMRFPIYLHLERFFDSVWDVVVFTVAYLPGAPSDYAVTFPSGVRSVMFPPDYVIALGSHLKNPDDLPCYKRVSRQSFIDAFASAVPIYNGGKP